MKPEDILPSEISQKDKFCLTPLLHEVLRVVIETESRKVVARGWGREEWEVNGYRISV